MSRDKLYINDTMFSHAPSSSWYNIPLNFDWVRNEDDETDEIILTDLFLVDKYLRKKKYGWLIEPPELTPNLYSFAISNYEKFTKIFTYDKNLLSLSDKFELLPIGGCWIDETDRIIYEKNKFICTITSHKRITNAHKYRHEIISKVSGIDVFGNGYRPINKKIDVLKEYKFCVVVENQKMDYLFTEKIIDCFLTGTVPIYYGCPSIDKFFNINGIITFDTMDDLNKIINTLTDHDYGDRLSFVEENFNLAKQYVVADDIIYEKLKKWKKVV